MKLKKIKIANDYLVPSHIAEYEIDGLCFKTLVVVKLVILMNSKTMVLKRTVVGMENLPDALSVPQFLILFICQYGPYGQTLAVDLNCNPNLPGAFVYEPVTDPDFILQSEWPDLRSVIEEELSKYILI